MDTNSNIEETRELEAKEELRLELTSSANEIVKLRSQLHHAAEEINRLKEEFMMDKPEYEFEFETERESIAMIIGYDVVDGETENIRLVRMIEGLPENDSIVEAVRKNYEWEKEQKVINGELSKQAHMEGNDDI